MGTNSNVLRLILLIIVSGVIAYGWYSFRTYPKNTTSNNLQQTPYIRINNTHIPLELAITDAEKTKGLGYRDSLPDDTGMLFIYDRPFQYSFWMQGMRFSIDFLWIDNNKVEDIHEKVAPPEANQSPLVVSPRVPVRYILEVNSGFIQSHNIKIGDPAILKL